MSGFNLPPGVRLKDIDPPIRCGLCHVEIRDASETQDSDGMAICEECYRERLEARRVANQAAEDGD